MSRERNLLSRLVDEAADTELQRRHAEAQAHLQDYDANEVLMDKFVIPVELKRVAGILAKKLGFEATSSVSERPTIDDSDPAWPDVHGSRICSVYLGWSRLHAGAHTGTGRIKISVANFGQNIEIYSGHGDLPTKTFELEKTEVDKEMVHRAIFDAINSNFTDS